MTPPVSYYSPNEITAPKFAFAFAKGCKGTISDDLDYLHAGDVAAFGSPAHWPILRQAWAANRGWYYADHAYFGRGNYYRVTRNAFQHDGRGTFSPTRWQEFGITIGPWRRGSHIVVCPNSRAYFALHGLDADTWLDGVLRQLRRHSKRDLIIRWKGDVPRRPLKRDLQGAFACVVYSSAAALEALMEGVPVVTLAPFAATSRMGRTSIVDIEDPYRPDDREAFMIALAANQWTFSEIVDGVAWKALQAQEGLRGAA